MKVGDRIFVRNRQYLIKSDDRMVEDTLEMEEIEPMESSETIPINERIPQPEEVSPQLSNLIEHLCPPGRPRWSDRSSHWKTSRLFWKVGMLVIVTLYVSSLCITHYPSFFFLQHITQS